MRYVVGSLLFVAGVIHALPVSGVLGNTRLEALYGRRFDDPDVLLLMRHRAVLFGLLGSFLLLAAWYEALQPPTLVAGIVSALSFLLLAREGGVQSPAMQRVVRADVVALLCMIAAGVLRLL